MVQPHPYPAVTVLLVYWAFFTSRRLYILILPLGTGAIERGLPPDSIQRQRDSNTCSSITTDSWISGGSHDASGAPGLRPLSR
jgi:hypothetical protein